MKYVICYPNGGISDILFVINLCLDYCIKYNRILIIYAINNWIKDDIQKYISFSHPNIFNGDIISKIRELENTSIFPNEIKQIENLRHVWQHAIIESNIVIKRAGIYICANELENSLIYGGTDLSKEYEENVVIYYNCGGGLPENLFNYIKINSLVLNIYKERMNKIGENFISIHIRNTDINTDNLDDFLYSIRDEIDNNDFVFLASDDKKTIDFIKNLYGKKIYTFSSILDNSIGMHNIIQNQLSNEEIVIDCLVDLLMLASGKKIYCSQSLSGYSRNAEYLCNNKNILKNILGDINY